MDQVLQVVYKHFGGDEKTINPVALEKTAAVENIRAYMAAGGRPATPEEVVTIARDWSDEKRAEMIGLCDFLTEAQHQPTTDDIVKMAGWSDEQRKQALGSFQKEAQIIAQPGAPAAAPQPEDEAVKVAALLGAGRADGYFNTLVEKAAADANKGGDAPPTDEGGKSEGAKKVLAMLGKPGEPSKGKDGKDNKPADDSEKCAMPLFDRMGWTAANQMYQALGLEKVSTALDHAVVVRGLELLHDALVTPPAEPPKV